MTVRQKAPGRDEIAAGRAAAGLTQEAAGALVHVARRTWQDWERGERTMPAGLWELFWLKAFGSVPRDRRADTPR